MFFVSDTQQDRHKMIRAFLSQDKATVAVLLAAVDFEWSIRRAVLALGGSTTKHIRHSVLGKKDVSGPKGYKDAWNPEIGDHLKITIDQAIPHWGRLIDPDRGAFRLRNQIAHGIRGSVSLELATAKVSDFLLASQCLANLAEKYNTSLFRRIVRRKPRGKATQ